MVKAHRRVRSAIKPHVAEAAALTIVQNIIEVEELVKLLPSFVLVDLAKRKYPNDFAKNKIQCEETI